MYKKKNLFVFAHKQDVQHCYRLSLFCSRLRAH